MPQITQKDVGDIVKKMNAMYQPPDGRCAATPKQMDFLVRKLEKYTEKVQKQRYGWDPDLGWINRIDISWGSASHWANDMAHWQERLARYRDVLDDVPKSEWNTASGCKAIYTLVTAPLLDGIFYEELPGLNLNDTEKARMASGSGHPPAGILDTATVRHPGGHSNPKPPDVATPYSLGNGILIFQEFQRKNLEQLWEDIKKNFERILKLVPKVAFPIAGVLLGMAAIGLVGYGIYKSEQRPERFY